MSHMPTSAQPAGQSYRSLIVRYTGIGSEGTDITVPIGTPMLDTTYAVTVTSAGGTSGDGTQTSGVEVVDMPRASRTTTQFRVVLGQALAAGDVLEFIVTGTVA